MYARDHALIATPVGAIRIDGDESVITGLRICGEGLPGRGSAAAVREAVDPVRLKVASGIHVVVRRRAAARKIRQSNIQRPAAPSQPHAAP